MDWQDSNWQEDEAQDYGENDPSTLPSVEASMDVDDQEVGMGETEPSQVGHPEHIGVEDGQQSGWDEFDPMEIQNADAGEDEGEPNQEETPGNVGEESSGRPMRTPSPLIGRSRRHDVVSPVEERALRSPDNPKRQKKVATEGGLFMTRRGADPRRKTNAPTAGPSGEGTRKGKGKGKGRKGK
jgi:hypothetical protein